MANIIKMTKYLINLLLLLSCTGAFCQDSLTSKNNLKISILSLVDNAKFQYERVIGRSTTIGLTASIFYLNPVVGIKIEPAFRYYFKKHSPTGWYIEPKLLIGYFNTKEDFKKFYYTYNASGNLINHKEEDYQNTLSFIPMGVALKVGLQKYFGKKNRFVFDYNFGFQYFPYNYSRKHETTEYYDLNGNRNVIETSPGGIEPNPGNSAFWYLFGAGSIFYSNISIGYNF
jgi:hypothetical protein